MREAPPAPRAERHDRGLPTGTRIGFVVEAMPTGGLEAFVLRAGAGLRALGGDVTVVVVRERGEWFGRIAEAGLRVLDLTGTWRGESLGARVRHARNVGRALAAERFDVLFVNHVASAQAVLGMLPPSTRAVPILHNDTPFVYDIGLANRPGWNVAVSVGPRVTREAVRRVGRDSVREIVHGVDMPGRALLDGRAPWSPELRIAFVGRLRHEQKGIFHLPDIARRLVERGVAFRISVIGDGSDRRRLERAVADSGVARYFEFHGLLDRARVLEALLGAHALVMPSYFEGFPLTLLEAQGCGCVPVASLLPGITDAATVPDETALLVPVDDVEGFTTALASLAADRERWTAMSRRAAVHAQERFSAERMVDEYRLLVEELLAGHYPRPARGAPALPLNVRVLPWQDSVPHWLLGLARRVYRGRRIA